MPRLLGVELPAKKKIGYSLRYIYGIGPARADLIVETALAGQESLLRPTAPTHSISVTLPSPAVIGPIEAPVPSSLSPAE